MASKGFDKHRHWKWTTRNDRRLEFRADDEPGESKLFGEHGGYWDKHDVITDKFDQDMMGRLNSELDNMLIFVSETGHAPLRDRNSLFAGWSRPVSSRGSTLHSLA